MPIQIEERYRDLLVNPVCATFVTIMPDGGPQATVVWFLYDAPYLLVSSLKTSRKTRNIVNDPRVALVMMDPQDNSRYIQVRGVVVAVAPDPDAAMIDRIARYYTGEPYYGGSEPLEDKGTVEHVTFKIDPQHVTTLNV